MRLADKTKTDAAGKKRQSSFVIRLISLVLVALSMTATTMAWISLNANNQSNRMNMNVDYDKFFVEATYYKYNPKAQVGHNVESSANLTDIHFNQYDLVFRSRNRYTPIVAAIKMTGEDLPSSGTITVTIHRDPNVSGSYEDSNGIMRIAEKFSTIMRVTAMVGANYYSSDSQTLFENVDSDINYNQARAQTGDTSNSKVFATATTSSSATPGDATLALTGVTSHDITIDIDYTADDFIDVDGDSVKESLFVYLYITYDEGYDGDNYNGLLGIYTKTSESMGIGAVGDISDTSVMFANDLVSIKVSHSPKN